MNPEDVILPPAPSGPAKIKRKVKPSDGTEHYGVSQHDDKFKIRYQRPEVAKHCARVLIQNNMDYEAATAKMLGSFATSNKLPDPTDAQIIRWAQILRDAPQIQKALQERLKEIGVDDGAQKLWLSLLWNAALDKVNDKRWPSAMKILGEAMQMGKRAADEANKPIALPLQDMAKGLKKMGLPEPKEVLDSDTIEDEDFDFGSSE